MKICLVRGGWVAPRGTINNEPTPPVGLAYIAGSLKAAGMPAQGIDAAGQALNRIAPVPGTALQVNGIDIDGITAQIDPEARVIGVSAMFSHEWTYLRSLICSLKQHFPEALIIAGGEHCTALPEYTLRDCASLDYIGCGEGEELMTEFCRTVKSGQDPSGLSGLAYLRNGRFLANAPRARIRDIDAIPWPDWDAFPLEPYHRESVSFGAGFGRNMPMLASRGCPYQCTFCSSPGMWTTRYVIRSPDRVLEEIEHYQRRFKITGLQFYDLTAILERDWILEFCRKLAARGIDLDWSLPVGTRSEALDVEVLNWLAKTNCRYLVYAPESGSAATLERIKKRVKLERMEQSIRSADERGIVVRTNMIIGFPHETRGQIFETLREMLKFAWLGVDEVLITPFQPYPGTELFGDLLERGKVRLNDGYFETLASLSSGMLSPPKESFCERVGRHELFFYRIFGLTVFTALSYLLRPRRIWRTIYNLAFTNRSSNGIEQRIRDKLRHITSSLQIARSSGYHCGPRGSRQDAPPWPPGRVAPR